MPIGSTKTTTPNSNKTTASASSGPGGGGRTTFRPPWVKADVPESKPKTTIKTSAPWVKKTTANESSRDDIKNNGETTKPIPATNKLASTSKATVPIKPPSDTSHPKEAKLQSREIKVPIMTEKRKPVLDPIVKPKPKKPPTPSESEEDEEDEDEEEETESETESESEEDQIPPSKKEAESELERKFKAEKPKLRPVVVKRDKSLSTVQKRHEDDEENEAEEGETEEDRERQRRFKLERPKLRHIVINKQKSFNKSTDDFDKIRPVLKKVQKVDDAIKESPMEPKPEFKDKVLKKVTPIKKDPSKPNVIYEFSESEPGFCGANSRKEAKPTTITYPTKSSITKVPAPPPLPSLVPKAPPPPPPPLCPPTDFQKNELSKQQKATLEKLKTRPRRRPDWSEMMKEVESGKKLRHVQCNDRSQPIITCKSMTKVDDKFVYETEKANAHNKLLKQIQGGIRLKSVKTNDRSRPFLDGLRKFRRQMTIEEQIQKSESKAALNEVAQLPDEPSGDELDDIDKLRDDLQSTKQMLALELRNREAQERENKRLLAKIANLEAELQRDKTRIDNDDLSTSPAVVADDALVKSLKKDAEDARKTSKDLEKKYEKSAEELDATKSMAEEQKRMIAQLEKKLAHALQQPPYSNHITPQFSFCYSFEDPTDTDIYYDYPSTTDCEIENAERVPMPTNENISNYITYRTDSLKGGTGSINGSRRSSEANPNKESSPELELELSESEEDEDEEKKADRKRRRLAKEVKIFKTKLTKLKNKQEVAKKERENLKQLIKKNHILLKEEKKKFKKLEKEVQKMAASMKEDEGDENDEEEEDGEDEEHQEEEQEEQESEEEEESDEETESEESDEGSGSDTESESEPEDASDEEKKANLEPRIKKHENRLSALKKGNVLLQANVDNLQDEISKVREKASSLQAELDAVLADLGL